MTPTRSWGPFALALLFLAVAFQSGYGAEPKEGDKAPPAAKPESTKPDAAKPDAAKPDTDGLDQAKLEAEFAEMLSNSQLVGKFSIVGDKGTKEGGEDKYTIRKVTKLKSGSWLIESRIQYGKYDLTVPLVLKVIWADDTPMISLTDLTIPGMGTFTSRVMFYRGQYAGTWQHGEVGGHMWGRVVKLPKEGEDPESSKPTSKEKEPAKVKEPATEKKSAQGQAPKDAG